MDDAEREAAAQRGLAMMQAVRDAIPEGPGLVLSEREAHVVVTLISLFVESSPDDIPGVILYHTGGLVLDDDEVVALSNKIREVLARTSHEPQRSI